MTTHKMLEFVNKRTKKNIEYRHTEEKIFEIMKWFGIVAVGAVVAYMLLKPIWNHWVFWFIASLVIIWRLRLSILPAALASSTAIFTMCLGSVVTSEAKAPSSLEAVASKQASRAGSFRV